MDWINGVIAIVGVATGWGLTELSNIWRGKRNDKRKLKRLLFFLMELRYYISKEISFSKNIEKYVIHAMQKLSELVGEEIEYEVEMFKPLFEHLRQSADTDNQKYTHLENNIDEIIIELAEIFPMLAYNLNGKHNIKSRLQKTERYITEIEGAIAQSNVDFDIKSFLEPLIENELLKEIDNSIESIARLINRRTFRSAVFALADMEEPYASDVDYFMARYVDYIRHNYGEGQNR